MSEGVARGLERPPECSGGQEVSVKYSWTSVAALRAEIELFKILKNTDLEEESCSLEENSSISAPRAQN